MDKLKQVSDGSLSFRCPGCGEVHNVTPEGARNGSAAKWQWNGSMNAPTFSPSVLVTSGHYVAWRSSEACWCTYNRDNPENPAPFSCYRCHSFVRGGLIEFLSDCTHALAGKTVAIPAWEE